MRWRHGIGCPGQRARRQRTGCQRGADHLGLHPVHGRGTVTAGIEGVAFAPNTITAAVGDVIAWTNNDTVPHTATLTTIRRARRTRWNAGDSGGMTFSAAGTYAFFCKIHPAMTGTIEITG